VRLNLHLILISLDSTHFTAHRGQCRKVRAAARGRDTLKGLISKRTGSVYFGILGTAAHKPTLEGPHMSDLRKITDERKTERESSYGVEKRKLRALEDTADALEGIRQDLTGLPEAFAARFLRVLPK
jgi:hypothetical protein